MDDSSGLDSPLYFSGAGDFEAVCGSSGATGSAVTSVTTAYNPVVTVYSPFLTVPPVKAQSPSRSWGQSPASTTSAA